MNVLRVSLACLILLFGCSVNRTASPPPSQSPSPFPSPTPTLSERGLAIGDLKIVREEQTLLRLVVELAETPEAQARGLMNVERLDENAGMAFIDNVPSRSPFYMKNTLIPLDIAFWDTDNLIVDVLEMEPCRADPCPLYAPRKNYVGAVEANVGVMAKNGVKIGDRVVLSRR